MYKDLLAHIQGINISAASDRDIYIVSGFGVPAISGIYYSFVKFSK
jgi:ribosomal protein S12